MCKKIKRVVTAVVVFVGEIKGGCGPPGRTGAGVEANRAEKRQKKKSFWRRAGAGFFGAVVKGLKKSWQRQNKKALPAFQNALSGARVQVCFFCGSILPLLP